MSTISADGSNQSVFLDMSDGNIRYSVGSSPGSWTIISFWPVTITNTNPSSTTILNVIATTDMSFNQSNCYFITNSNYITFDGSNNPMTMSNITNYGGLIQNGTSSTNGYSFINVMRYVIAANHLYNSNLARDGGWVCRAYFGKNANGNSVSDCTNNADLGQDGNQNIYGIGGILGAYAGNGASSRLSVSNCKNYGNIYGTTGNTFDDVGGGGIVGRYCGQSNYAGIIDISYCENYGIIYGTDCGGIVGSDLGYSSSNLGNYNNNIKVSYCANYGDIAGDDKLGIRCGGIVGGRAGFNGKVSITSCFNNGAIRTYNGGGIVGAQAGYTNGSVSCQKCFNTGDMSSALSGGIVGGLFGYNSSQTFNITNCYNTADVSGSQSGGIIGADLGRSTSGSYNATINISNCYVLGTLYSTTGGIIGGRTGNNYVNNPTITLSNSYSAGPISGTGQGLIAATFNQDWVTTINTYVAGGNWNDATASTELTGTPSSPNTPGTTWISIATNTPYVLTAYNADIYNPNSVSSSSSYQSNPGVFQTGFTYILYTTLQNLNVLDIYVFTYKGLAPSYSSYNYNKLTLTNTTSSNDPMIASLNNASTGVLDIILPLASGPITIEADGLTQSVYLRMTSNKIEYSVFSSTGPWTLVNTTSNWPITIINTNPTSSSILDVIFLGSLTISDTYGDISGNFIVGSDYINFNGENYDININSIFGYDGFIQNGLSTSDGKNYISVENINTHITDSTLNVNGGWLCQSYFGKNAAGNSITNCTNDGFIIADNCGGIMGAYAGTNGTLNIENCINYGKIQGYYAGGIVGGVSGLCNTNQSTLLQIIGCTNNGNVNGYNAGGIAGANTGNGKYPIDADPSGSVQTNSARTLFRNCLNNGDINAENGGGIAGSYVGYNTGLYGVIDSSYAVVFTECNNTGVINAQSSAGIAGIFAGGGAPDTTGGGSVYFENCSNSGDIYGVNGGGIAANYAGAQNYPGYGQRPVAKFINCTNSGNILQYATSGGGIAANGMGSYGSGYCENCLNTGYINATGAGGIVGVGAGSPFGIAELTQCISAGNINGEYAGGIAGDGFGGNTSQPCVINNCYSIGNITGGEAGGIVGSKVGYIYGFNQSPVVNITNSYSLGIISGSQAGGIAGGNNGAPWHLTNTATINITNCYSYGVISNGSDGILSPGYDKPNYVHQTNCYSANGSWLDASANLALTSGTTPTDINTNNPGTIWTTLSTAFTPNIPYVLSAFNNELYTPNNASSNVNYSTNPGLFQPDFKYKIINNVQSNDVATTRVFAYKGSSPYYYSYNSNIFTLTNTNGVVNPNTIYVAVAETTGVLNYTLPVITDVILTQDPNPFNPYALSPDNVGKVGYTDKNYIVIPDISNNPTYVLSTDITDRTFDVFQNSKELPAAFIPNSLFIDNNLIAPSGIAMDSDGNFYVGNSPYNEISVYDNNGTYLRTINIYTAVNIPILKISYIAMDESDILYVTSEGNTGVYVVPAGSSTNDLDETILKYIYGNDLRGLACNGNYLYIVKEATPKYVIKYNLTNKKYLYISLSNAVPSIPLTCQPAAIVYNNIESAPTLYITTIDGSNNRIYSISNITGTELITGGIGNADIYSNTIFSDTDYPYSISIDNSANLYVGLDEGGIQPVNVSSVGKIARITSAGDISNTSYLTYDGLGIGRPLGLLFEGDNNLYVSNILYDRVIKCQPKTFVFGQSLLNADAFYIKNPLDPTKFKTYLYDETNSIIYTTFELTADCFQKGTQILCMNDTYVSIENIKIGDFVKTYKHGYKKVIMCKNTRSCDYVHSSKNQIYVYKKTSSPELTEDLYLTGGHSLLLDALSEIELKKMKETLYTDINLMVEDKYKLMCCFNNKMELSSTQNVELYRIALEPTENASSSHVYGIWANGILTESNSVKSMEN